MRPQPVVGHVRLTLLATAAAVLTAAAACGNPTGPDASRLVSRAPVASRVDASAAQSSGGTIPWYRDSSGTHAQSSGGTIPWYRDSSATRASSGGTIPWY